MWADKCQYQEYMNSKWPDTQEEQTTPPTTAAPAIEQTIRKLLNFRWQHVNRSEYIQMHNMFKWNGFHVADKVGPSCLATKAFSDGPFQPVNGHIMPMHIAHCTINK